MKPAGDSYELDVLDLIEEELDVSTEGLDVDASGDQLVVEGFVSNHRDHNRLRRMLQDVYAHEDIFFDVDVDESLAPDPDHEREEFEDSYVNGRSGSFNRDIQSPRRQY